MKRIYDITVANGKYQNKDGVEKTSYLKIGVVFERPDGSQCMKLESIPVGFDGWGNFYAPKMKELRENIEKTAVKSYNKPLNDEEESQIPF